MPRCENSVAFEFRLIPLGASFRLPNAPVAEIQLPLNFGMYASAYLFYITLPPQNGKRFDTVMFPDSAFDDAVAEVLLPFELGDPS
ncbi:hypothetical protein D5086_027252 [Populus alba]|uniref:Uncharacterized protein n=1 Tax=Populus alba TaxID=43335 RepID=A0ACC4AW61_POPAL